MHSTYVSKSAHCSANIQFHLRVLKTENIFRIISIPFSKRRKCKCTHVRVKMSGIYSILFSKNGSVYILLWFKEWTLLIACIMSVLPKSGRCSASTRMYYTTFDSMCRLLSLYSIFYVSKSGQSLPYRYLTLVILSKS